MQSPLIPDRILQFLNSLPVTGNPLEWIHTFRDQLCRLLGDVDRITVKVNVNCDLENPEDYRPEMSISQHVVANDNEDGAPHTTSQPINGALFAQLLEELRIQGYPFAQYHPPHCIDYYFGGQAYLGTIILWRDLGEEQISLQTLQTMEKLEPFLLFAFSDLVARHQRAEPDSRIFTDALQYLTQQVRLSRQEQRVVTLQLFGYSYKDIASMLGVTVDGVKHHLKMIHRKTGTRSYTELFAKYFMPRLDLIDQEEEGDAGMKTEISPQREDIPSFAIVESRTPEERPTAYFNRGSTLGERTRQFGELAFASIEEFGRAMRVAPSNLQKYLNGERNPGLGTLQRLYDLGCNINSLISGEGEVFAENDTGRAALGRAMRHLPVYGSEDLEQ